MAEISFEDIKFFDSEENIKAVFLKLYYFYIKKENIEKIGEFYIKDEKIFIDAEQSKAERRVMMLIDEGLRNLKNSLNNKETIYVHKNSGIPLIGSGSFGIVDRGTNLIEIKPSTGCNIKCIYCSVDEDKRRVDFVVEAGYMVDELKKLIQFKESNDIEVHIGCQGEPLLYSPLCELVSGISKIKGVKEISMDTNGTMLTKNNVNKLIGAGMTRFNVSLNALDKDVAKRIAGMPYKVEKVMDICRFIAKRSKIIITPVIVPGINESEIEGIIDFAYSINPKGIAIGLQNFMEYKYGRNPVKQWSAEKFIGFLRKLEKKKNIKLLLGPDDFNIKKTKALPKVFRKGQIVNAKIVCKGRLPKEMIAVADNRVITVLGYKNKNKVKVKITRTKHNIYYGICL